MPDRILVADDEEIMSGILASMLRAAGYECETVGSGVEALALLRSGARFDLISSDVMMAEMDGLALLEQIKVEFPDLPLVFVCPINDPGLIRLTREKGALDYLTLPCSREEYLAMIRKALDTHRHRGEPTLG